MNRLRYMVLLQVSVVSMLTLLMCSKSVEHETGPFTKAELGRLIFFDKDLSEPGRQACASCHDPSTGFSDPRHAATSEGAIKGVFGNRNSPAISYAHYTPALQFHAEDGSYTGGFFLDGRAGTLEENEGLFKVPGLRNIALSAPYFHNGLFNTLEEVVHFYNSRDLGEFDHPEIRKNVNREELGNLGLSPEEEKAIVAFLRTLSDGYGLK